jgi:hypothetical protein
MGSARRTVRAGITKINKVGGPLTLPHLIYVSSGQKGDLKTALILLLPVN